MKTLLLALTIFFSLTSLTFAQDGSGACSWHGGVNCSAGMQLDGRVVCNDGSRESVVEYEFVQMCKKDSGGDTMDYAIRNHTFIQTDLSVPDWSSVNSKCLNEMYQNVRYIERVSSCSQYTQNIIDNAIRFRNCPSNAEKIITGSGLSDFFCRCNSGYYNYPTESGNQGYCSAGEAPLSHDEQMMLFRQGISNAVQEINDDYRTSVANNSQTEIVNEPVTVPVTDSNSNRAVTKVADPVASCRERFGVNGIHLPSNDGQIKCGCAGDYSLGADGKCSWTAEKPAENKPNSSNTAADANSGASNEKHLVWVFLFVAFTLISVNTLRVMSSRKKSDVPIE